MRQAQGQVEVDYGRYKITCFTPSCDIPDAPLTHTSKDIKISLPDDVVNLMLFNREIEASTPSLEVTDDNGTRYHFKKANIDTLVKSDEGNKVVILSVAQLRKLGTINPKYVQR